MVHGCKKSGNGLNRRRNLRLIVAVARFFTIARGGDFRRSGQTGIFRVTGHGWAFKFATNRHKHMGNFTAFETKMTAAGMGDAAIRAFRRNYEALLRNETGMIPESSISPAVGLPSVDSIESGRRGGCGVARTGRGDQTERRPGHQHGPARA